MKYVILFEDNDEFAHMRPKYMADHLEFLSRNADKIDSAGPLKDSASGDPAGGIWIVDVEDTSQARALVEEDPFYPTGLRKSIRILEWTQTFADGKRMI